MCIRDRIIGHERAVDQIIVDEILRALRHVALAGRETALIGQDIADLQPERQRVGGEQAARMFRGLDQAVARLRVGQGGAVGAGTAAGVGEAIVRHALPHRSVEVGVIGEDRPVGRDRAGQAEREAVDARLAVEHLQRAGQRGVVRRHAVIAAFVAEQRGGDQQLLVHELGFRPDLVSAAGFGRDVAIGCLLYTSRCV